MLSRSGREDARMEPGKQEAPKSKNYRWVWFVVIAMIALIIMTTSVRPRGGYLSGENLKESFNQNKANQSLERAFKSLPVNNGR